MEKQVKKYTDMTNEEKAQAIYDYMKKNQREELESLLLDISPDDTDEPVMLLEDWVECYQVNGNLFELLQIVQKSKELDLDDNYIRASIYYNGYVTSDNILNLVDEDEAVEWIENALDDGYDLLEDINKVMKIKFN